MKKCLFILYLIPTVIYSQVDSLKAQLNYYPLQNGNYWEYKTISQEYPYPSDSSAFSVEVQGDTMLDNNNDYKILLHQDIYPDNYLWYYYERIDSTNGFVYRYKNDTSLENKEVKIYGLFAQPGDTIDACISGSSNPEHFLTICKSEANDTLFGISTQMKKFDDITNIPAEEYELAKGFGNYIQNSCEFSCGSTFIVYAKINGIEYGSRIITSIIENKTMPSGYQLYQNYPNPFNPSTNISFVIPKSGNVTFRVYDMLGKLIEENNLLYSNGGIHKIKFNGNNYSSGIYLYQIEYAGQIRTRKMLLLK